MTLTIFDNIARMTYIRMQTHTKILHTFMTKAKRCVCIRLIEMLWSSLAGFIYVYLSKKYFRIEH